MLIRAVYVTAGGTPCRFVQTETKSITLHLFHFFSPTLTCYYCVHYSLVNILCDIFLSLLELSRGIKELGVGT